MAEETKPVEALTETTPVETPVDTKSTTTTTTTVETKKSGSALPKILIILVVVMCLCVLCAGVAWFAFTRFAGAATNTFENALVNSVNNGSLNTGSNNGGSTTNDSNSTGSNDSTDSSFSFSASVPSTFPSDVPIYSGATASFSSSDVNSEGKQETTVTFALKANPDDVVAFYKSKMISNNYTLGSEINFFGQVMTFENAKREVIVTVIGAEGKDDVVLTIYTAEK